MEAVKSSYDRPRPRLRLRMPRQAIRQCEAMADQGHGRLRLRHTKARLAKANADGAKADQGKARPGLRQTKARPG